MSAIDPDIPNAASGTPGIPLGRHLRVLRRHAWVVLATGLLVGLLGWQLAGVLPATYEARLVLLIDGDEPARWAELLRGDEVLERANADATDLRRRLEVRGPTDAGALTLRVVGGDPGAIAREVRTIASAFEDAVAELDRARREELEEQRLAEVSGRSEQQQELERRRDDLAEEIAQQADAIDDRRQQALDAEVDVSTVADDARLQLLINEHDLLTRRIEELREPIESPDAMAPTVSILRLHGPTLAVRSLSTGLTVVAAAALGVLLGVLVAFVIDRFDTRLRDTDSVDALVGRTPVFHLPAGDPHASTRGVLALQAIHRWCRFAGDRGPLLLPVGDVSDVADGVASLLDAPIATDPETPLGGSPAMDHATSRPEASSRSIPAVVAPPLASGGASAVVDDPTQHVLLIVALGRSMRWELELTAAEIARLHPTAIVTVDIRTRLPGRATGSGRPRLARDRVV